MHDAIFVIEWRSKNGGSWRFWSTRFTEGAARRWIEREVSIHKNTEFRVVRYLREEPKA